MWRHSWKVEDRKKYCEAKEDLKSIISMAMNRAAWEVVEKVDSCYYSCELYLELPIQKIWCY